jgi:hypothetical protein
LPAKPEIRRGRLEKTSSLPFSYLRKPESDNIHSGFIVAQTMHSLLENFPLPIMSQEKEAGEQ